MPRVPPSAFGTCVDGDRELLDAWCKDAMQGLELAFEPLMLRGPVSPFPDVGDTPKENLGRETVWTCVPIERLAQVRLDCFLIAFECLEICPGMDWVICINLRAYF